MADDASGMISAILPPIIVGAVALKTIDVVFRQPSRRPRIVQPHKKSIFYYPKERKDRGLGFGDFSNLP